jgi:zinc transport system permease protein
VTDIPIITAIAEILQYDFMRRALIAGMIIALICPLIGIFLVLRRLSMIGDTLAHVSMAGVAAGLIMGINGIIGALVFTVAAAFGIEGLRKVYHHYAEIAIAVILSTGIGLAGLLISLGQGDMAQLFGYLFGSIMAVTRTDIFLILGVGLFVLGATVLLYKELFYISFDEEAAMLAGIPVSAINIFFVLLTAMTIAIAMRVVGILMVSSLMILPVATGLQVAKSFKTALFWAVGFAVFAVLTGLFSSYYLDTAPGGTIVLTSVLTLLIVILIKGCKDGLSRKMIGG